ncbi:MAG: aldo/keto reductase [Anaerolineaceae bacterium]|jgi:aryl-alcohol dehydrogenase-like predicted oxidoreductase
MDYRRLGNSGLKISEVGLGTNTFGMNADESTSIQIINQALDLGINFIDTAAMYARGRSEEIIGKAIKGKRDQVIIATKFGHRASLTPRDLGGSRSYIVRAVEQNLNRLETDYIDLYYLHYVDTETPIEETLRALNDLIHSGKVRYIACSNFAAWQLCEALLSAKIHNLESFIAIQMRYNMLDRSVECEIAPCCEKYGVGLIPWGPLAGGFLTGKYHRREKPTAGRLASGIQIYGNVLAEPNFDKIDQLGAFAKERGHSVSELAIAWLLSHKWLGSVIAGATSPQQLSANAAASSWKLTAEDVTQVEKII